MIMSRLLMLYALNRATAERKFEIKAEANEATIYLYDMIVGDDLTAEWLGGVSPNRFVREINQITAPVIHLRINCPGGDVFAARVMELAIRQHPSKVIAHIDGYAASAASFLAVACDEVEIAKGGFFMIHKAWSMCWGNADEMLKMADLLDKIDESLVTTYADETEQNPEQLRDWMGAETWFNADESIEYGFADRLAETEAKASTWDMSMYDKAPNAQVPADGPAEPDPIAPDNSFLNQDHRVRQQQRMSVLARTSIE
jgi:ATP-dependent Clp protease protease subunit